MPLAEVAERLSPEELERRVRQEKPEFLPTILAAVLASDGKRRGSTAIYLRPLHLRIAMGQEPPPTATNGSGPPSADAHLPIPARFGRGDGTVGNTVTQSQIDGWQKRCLSDIPHEAWPDLERRAREKIRRRFIAVDTLCQEMQRLWRADQAKANGKGPPGGVPVKAAVAAVPGG